MQYPTPRPLLITERLVSLMQDIHPISVPRAAPRRAAPARRRSCGAELPAPCAPDAVQSGGQSGNPLLFHPTRSAARTARAALARRPHANESVFYSARNFHLAAQVPHALIACLSDRTGRNGMADRLSTPSSASP